jgi:hypothetical protein
VGALRPRQCGNGLVLGHVSMIATVSGLFKASEIAPPLPELCTHENARSGIVMPLRPARNAEWGGCRTFAPVGGRLFHWPKRRRVRA